MLGARLRGVVLVACTAIVAFALACAPAASEKFPSKPVIFIAPGTIGGGSDVQARLAAEIVDKAGIFGTEPIAVLNKGGGGSQEAFTFLKSKKGDPHYLLTFQNSLLTYPMIGEAAYELTDFVPIANLVFDPVIVVVQTESPFKTLKDLIDAARAAPETITAGGGGVSGPDRMGLILLQDAAGFKLKYIPFAGGGEIHRNVLGGQVQVAVGNPSDFMASIEGGKLRGLALLDTQRGTSAALKDIPTAKEVGYDVSFVAWRGWFGPAGIKESHIAILEDGFKRVTEHPDFTEKYVDRFGMRVKYMPSKEFAPFLDEQKAIYERILKQAGVIG